MSGLSLDRDFSDLPADVLCVVIGKLLSPSDFVWFGAVCVHWRSALIQNHVNKLVKLPSSLPVLLIPSPATEGSGSGEAEDQQQDQQYYNNIQIDDERIEERKAARKQKDKYYQQQQYTTRSLYSLSDGKVPDLQLRIDGHCQGSSHGWLVVTTEADQNYSVRLLNPFLSVNNVIELPPLTTFRLDPGHRVYTSYYMIKAVISASPSSCSNPKDIVVMAIHGFSRLSFCKLGDTAWTPLPMASKPFEDVIYYKGLFYAIYQRGLVLSIEIDPTLNPPKPMVNVFVDPPPRKPGCDLEQKYLVESSGELLQVKRYKDYPDDLNYKTIYFKVFKLDFGLNNKKWVETKNLNGHTLFLGHNASISLLASDFPGCKPNCIYFTDDYVDGFTSNPPFTGPREMGIYNLEDESFEPFYEMQTKIIMPHPIWIQPSL